MSAHALLTFHALQESKKIVKTYNRIARTIIEFETLWQLAWTKSIDASKAGLQATLLHLLHL